MTANPDSFGSRIRKLLRFAAIYGPSRAIFKAAGRMRFRLPSLRRRRNSDIGLLGCGQFAVGTIGYFLQRRFGPRIAACYDIDPAAAASLARTLQVSAVCQTPEAVLRAPGIRLVYVASNHASHAGYAAEALACGLDVYIEKPIATSRSQLGTLLAMQRRAAGRVYAGYNRPFSAAVLDLRRLTTRLSNSPITLSCIVTGHRLPPDHWYRNPEEGTRVCGNFGHWLDLFVHLLAWRSTPDTLGISLLWSDESEPEDNICVAIQSPMGDLFTLTFTSRTDPFEGVAELVHFQHGDLIARIDDFRKMTIWDGPRLIRRRYWPKDVGHQRAVLQPFATYPVRDWAEVERSTLLTLHIADMVRERRQSDTFSFSEAREAVERLTRSEYLRGA